MDNGNPQPAPRKYHPSAYTNVQNTVGNATGIAKTAQSLKSGDMSSISFLLIWLMISGIFWIIGLIPIVNFFSDIIYWILFGSVYIAKFVITSKGQFISGKGALATGISLVCFVLGFIPFLDWIPWNVIGTVLLILIGKN